MIHIEQKKYYLLVVNSRYIPSVHDITHYLCISEGNNRYIPSMNNITYLYIDEGKYEEAEKYFLMLPEKNRPSYYLYGCGIRYYYQKKYEEAEKYLSLAIEKTMIRFTYIVLLLFIITNKNTIKTDEYLLLAIDPIISDTLRVNVSMYLKL